MIWSVQEHSMMKYEAREIRSALIVGLGSIGSRHLRVATELGYQVETVSRRAGLGTYRSIEDALGANSFDVVCIATETASHARNLLSLRETDHRGITIVEKPLFKSYNQDDSSQHLKTFVGYNLRTHPGIVWLQSRLRENDARVHQLQLSVAQNLNDWRPNRAARDVYSASIAEGGGALRDLSHELDLALVFLGAVKKVAAVGGRLGTVTLDADDSWSILLEGPNRSSASISINCLDRIPHRTFRVSTSSGTGSVDFISGMAQWNSEEVHFNLDRDATYRRMWQALAKPSLEADLLCSYEQGMLVMSLIEACEEASHTRQWVQLNG